MKTKLVTTAAKGLALGHLVATATADICVKLEANMCHKYLGHAKSETIKHRHNTTDQRLNNFYAKQAKK